MCGVERRPLAGASRFARGSLQVPDPRSEPERYREAVAATVEDREIDVLIPATDVSVGLLLDLEDRIPGLVVPQSGRERYERLSDKAHLTEIASSLGIAVPRQIVLDGPGHTPLDRLSEIGYPLVLKPSRSAVDAPGRVVTQGVRLVSSPDEAERVLEDLPRHAFPLLVQERIVGPGRGVFVLSWEGRLYAAFGHRRIREKPPTGGVSVYRESVRVSEELLRQSRSLLEHVGWNGVAMVEFKEDRETGTPYLMEVNARFWGSLQLAIDAGVDFPRLLVELATGQPVEPVTSYRTGIRSRWLWGEVDHLIGCLKADRALRRELPDLPGRLQAVLRFLVPWRPGDRYEVLRVGDPGPFLRESVQWFRVFTR